MPWPPSQPIRLLAVDIDGTLLTDSDRVSPTTRKALRRANDSVLLVLATGRRYRTTRRAMDDLGLELPVVCLGGALTKDASGATVESTPFLREDLSPLLDLARRHGQSLIFQRDSHALGGPDFIVDACPSWNEMTAAYVRLGGDRSQAVKDRQVLVGDDVLVVGCFGDEGPLAKFERDVQAPGPTFFEGAEPRGFETVLVPSKKTPGWYLEIIVKGVSKWAALERLASQHGIPSHAVCAVGDALNDLPMIRGAGWGVAMGNADPAVKAAANWTTAGNNDDGVAVLVERLLAGMSRDGWRC